MKRVLAAIVFAFAAGGVALAGVARPVVIELYTSQGCNSCLPANALAGKLAQKPNLLVLSFPVTYWDMFGWKDTLASEDNTKRQKSYASALKRGGVYTPQMILDGQRDVPGSRPDSVFQALGQIIDGAAKDNFSSGLSFTQKSDGIRLNLERAPERHRPDATVWLFRVLSGAKVKVTGGENAGQTVVYKNVVTGIQNLGPWHGEARSIDLPKPAGKVAAYDGIAVVVQQGGYGRVLAAGFLAAPVN